MKRKMAVFFLGLCLAVSACQPPRNQKPSDQEKETENQNNEPETQEGGTGNREGGTGNQEDGTGTQEGESGEAKPGAVPVLTYTDYSRKIKEEETGALLLKVKENLPVIELSGNEEAQEMMNRVFQQQHAQNDRQTDRDAGLAESAWAGLAEEEREDWEEYRFEYFYETGCVTNKILSVKATVREVQGPESDDFHALAYALYVPTGKLLTLSDVFTDERGAKTIVEPYIQKTVTGDPYEEYLLEDYENYISDVLTEESFYLTEQGLAIICNPGILTEAECGVIEIIIPYQELEGVMNADYLP